MAGKFFDVTTDVDAIPGRLGRRAKLIVRETRNAMTGIGEAHIARMVAMHRAPPKAFPQRKSTNEPLSRRTGSLLDSLAYRIEARKVDGDPEIRLRNFSAGNASARLQELGTVGAGGKLPDITPKRARILAIPTEHAQTRAGDVRGGPRSYDGFWLKTSGGTLLFVEKSTNKALFVGVHRVAVPPRLKHRATFRKNMPEHKRRLQAGVRKALTIRLR